MPDVRSPQPQTTVATKDRCALAARGGGLGTRSAGLARHLRFHHYISLSAGEGGRHQHDARPRRPGADFVNKFVYRWEPIQRGDIVVFRYPRDPSKSYIKRVIGVAGDRIRIENGQVYVNGEALDEDYVPSDYADAPFLWRSQGSAEEFLRPRRSSHDVQRQPRLRYRERTLHLRESRLRILADGEDGKAAVSSRATELEYFDSTLNVGKRLQRDIQRVARRIKPAKPDLHLSYFFSSKALKSLGAIRLLWASSFFFKMRSCSQDASSRCASEIHTSARIE